MIVISLKEKYIVKMIPNKASQFASELAGLVSLALAGRRYKTKDIKCTESY